jgi:hypothetical protein
MRQHQDEMVSGGFLALTAVSFAVLCSSLIAFALT